MISSEARLARCISERQRLTCERFQRSFKFDGGDVPKSS